MSLRTRLDELRDYVEAATDATTRQTRALMRSQIEPLWHRITGAVHGLYYVTHLLRGNDVSRDSLRAQLKPSEPPVLLIHGFLGTRGAMAVLESRLRETGHVVFSFN